MNRSTGMYDTPHGPMLFSPVLAHELEPGDLVMLPLVDSVGRLTGVPRSGPSGVGIQLVTDAYRLPVTFNEPVLRAVGARAAGVL